MIQSMNDSTNSTKVPAIEDGICSRCGGTSFELDAYERRFCVDCAHLSKMNEDDTFYRYERKVLQNTQKMNFSFILSEKQKAASNFLLQKTRNRESVFLNAVCGAGKTEMLFSSIFDFLSQGKRVCISVPRVQVVKELANRLKDVFPDANVLAIHQDQKIDELSLLLVVSTMQLHRYYEEFDLLIVDEVDAYPLLGNVYLHRLIRRSLKKDGTLVFLSATLPTQLSKVVKQEAMTIHRVNRRFHGHDLDLPVIRFLPRLDSLLYQGILPKKLVDSIRNTPRSFIYVPTIRLASILEKSIRHKGFTCASITSKSQDKDILLKAFEQEKIAYLITTTILERGVTFSRLNVLVLLADHEVYSQDTLVQICGRVGRKSDAPHGTIEYFSGSISKAMRNSIRQIRIANRVDL